MRNMFYKALGGVAVLLVGVGMTLVSRPAGAALPDGTSVTVNGFPMHGEGSRKLAGCELTAGVEWAGAAAHSVRFVVAGASPSGSATVVDETSADALSPWSSGPHDLTAVAAQAGLAKKSNGYHLRITISVDGTTAGSALYWLACGVDQHAGHSWSVPLSVHWFDATGKNAAPPSGLGSFKLEGSSKQGTASCVYTGSSLVCTYGKASGHGEEEEPGDEAPPTGIRVSGKGSYTLTLGGVPAGWRVDAATIGTFTPREECPEPPVPPDEEEPQGRTDCPHSVVIRAVAAPTTTTTTTKTGVVAASSTTTTTSSSRVEAAAEATTGSTVGPTGTLPRTGASNGSLAGVGLGLIVLGLAMVAGLGRRATRIPRHDEGMTR